MKKVKLTGLLFGEGGRDKAFLTALKNIDKFKFHTKLWRFSVDCSFGCSPKDILESCNLAIEGVAYDLVICILDLDKLKQDFPSSWEQQKLSLEQHFSRIKVVWLLDNAEDEYRRVLNIPRSVRSKRRINLLAIESIETFINTKIYTAILEETFAIEQR